LRAVLPHGRGATEIQDIDPRGRESLAAAADIRRLCPPPHLAPLPPSQPDYERITTGSDTAAAAGRGVSVKALDQRLE